MTKSKKPKNGNKKEAIGFTTNFVESMPSKPSKGGRHGKTNTVSLKPIMKGKTLLKAGAYSTSKAARGASASRMTRFNSQGKDAGVHLFISIDDLNSPEALRHALEEEIEIAKGIAADEETRGFTESEFAKMVHTEQLPSEVQSIISKSKGGRPPKAEAERKVRINIMIDPDISARLKTLDRSASSFINDVVRAALDTIEDNG